MDLQSLFESLGRSAPRKRLDALSSMLLKAGVATSATVFTGFITALTIFLGLALLLATSQLSETRPYSVLFGASSLLAFGIAYMWLILAIDRRKRAIENVLPDFLQLAAANVRAGMPVDRAMWQAARPEFGLLTDEINQVARETFGGEPFSSTLDRLGMRFDSKTLQRTVRLIKQALVSGGEMANVLEETARDIRNAQIIRKEISATLLLYVIFIVFASSFGAPFLFAVSYKMMAVLEAVLAQVPNVSALSGQLPSSLGATLVNPAAPAIKSSDFLTFALVASLITAFFSSVLISVIRTGAKKHFVRYLPIFVAIQALVFLGITTALQAFFAGLTGVA